VYIPIFGVYMSDEIKLTDEQVDTLSNDPVVKTLRTRFLTLLADSLKHGTPPERVDAVDTAKESYETAHHAKLVQHVIDNPPTPRSIPVVSRRGFK
jgi:hypothetical protein